MQFAGLKCLQDARADTLETRDDLVWVCDNLVRDGYEHPFYYFDEHIQPDRWLIFFGRGQEKRDRFCRRYGNHDVVHGNTSQR